MHKLITLRFALPTIVVLAIVTIAIVIVALVAGAHAGTAYQWPG